jgi:hypothetical protein
MSHHCQTCNLQFSTCSNLRKHERTEKHLAKCQTIVIVETKTVSLEQEIKELKEKLERAEYKIELQNGLIQSYQSIITKFAIPCTEVVEPVPEPETEPETEPEPVKGKKVKKIKIPLQEVEIPVPIETFHDPPPKLVIEELEIPEVVSKKKKVKKVELTKEEQDKENNALTETLYELWNTDYETEGLTYTLEQINSYKPKSPLNEKVSTWIKNYKIMITEKDTKEKDMRNRFSCTRGIDDKLENEISKYKVKDGIVTLEPETDKETEPIKPRRKLKIIQDPPKNLKIQ